MGFFLLFLMIIIKNHPYRIPDFNCDMLWRRHHFCLSSQNKVVSINKRRGCLLRVVISNELEWKKYTNQVRNKTCLWKCWECGKLFHPYKGFESTSHFCCVDCSNKYWEKEQKQGIRHCRYCSRTYKPSVSTYGNVHQLCCPDCTAIVTKINYKLVDWQKEKFKNGRCYRKEGKKIQSR